MNEICNFDQPNHNKKKQHIFFLTRCEQENVKANIFISRLYYLSHITNECIFQESRFEIDEYFEILTL